jgi:hypothetical protein
MTADFEKDEPRLAIKGSLQLNLRSYDMTPWDFGGSKSGEANNGGESGGEKAIQNDEDAEIPDFGQIERIGEEEFNAAGAHCIVFKWNGLGWVSTVLLKARC